MKTENNMYIYISTHMCICICCTIDRREKVIMFAMKEPPGLHSTSWVLRGVALMVTPQGRQVHKDYHVCTNNGTYDGYACGGGHLTSSGQDYAGNSLACEDLSSKTSRKELAPCRRLARRRCRLTCCLLASHHSVISRDYLLHPWQKDSVLGCIQLGRALAMLGYCTTTAQKLEQHTLEVVPKGLSEFRRRIAQNG